MRAILSAKQCSMALIAANGASGNLKQLKECLADGLDAGLTINEIKEILCQLYAYAGFPRSLNALGTFMTLLDERKAQGLNDAQGDISNAVNRAVNSYEVGSANQTRLVGQRVSGRLFEFAPQIDEYLKAHLFGDIFSRDLLSWTDRELATVAALANISGVNSQLIAHLNIAMYNAVSEQQLRQLVKLFAMDGLQTAGENISAALDEILTD